jgi:hypothetical protein
VIEALIAKWVPALAGLAGRLEAIRAQHPDLAPQIDPLVAALRAQADPVVLGNVAGTALAELQRLLETGKLDPRFKPSDLS